MIFYATYVRSTNHSNYCACNTFLVFSAVYQLVSIYTETYCNVCVSFELSSRDKRFFHLSLNFLCSFGKVCTKCQQVFLFIKLY